MIHGGAHGAWCWQPLLGLLQAPMLAIDLPGRGCRAAPLEELSYARLADSAAADIRKYDLHDVVLVAHSMGGITAIQLMEKMADRLRHVIFIASPVPPVGESIGGFMARQISASSESSAAHAAIESGKGDQNIADMLYHDCSADDRAWAMARITPESMAVYHEPVSLTGVGCSVSRTYIRTLKDRGLPLALQDESIGRLGPVRIKSIDTGHTPMLADPADLAAILEETAA